MMIRSDYLRRGKAVVAPNQKKGSIKSKRVYDGEKEHAEGSRKKARKAGEVKVDAVSARQ